MSRLLALFLILSAGLLRARTFLDVARPFTDHMVLQRDMPVPVWGTAEPGEVVTVKFAKQTKKVTADDSGHWQVELKPQPASAEGRTLTITGDRSPLLIELQDVLVGEVWLCSGQTNMDFTLARTDKYFFAGVQNEAAEIAAANYPEIRMFTGNWKCSYQPETVVRGEWKICTPEAAREFSAIGYFFARDLQQKLRVPIGIITLAYPASTAQAWIRRDAIAANPRLQPTLAGFDAEVKAYVAPTEAEIAAWQAAVEQARENGTPIPRRPKPDPVQNQHNPTVCFNGLIAPVVPYAIRGILWYQGESSDGDPALFPLWNETLIKDWRQLWGRETPARGRPPLPFYYCQLAGLRNDSNSPVVREQQAEALKLPDTAMAVSIDIGNGTNVFPPEKQDVAARLCRIALANTYGESIEWSGPQFTGLTAAGSTLRLAFAHTGGGLVAKGGPLATFEIAGADGKYVPAEAVIQGSEVVVHSPAVAAPTAVRYAWADYPEGCNLYNGAGLPAVPFRSKPAP